MDELDWTNGYARTLGVYLNGEAIDEVDERGERVFGDSFLLVMNAHFDRVAFTLPGAPFGEAWSLEIDTAQPTGLAEDVDADAEPLEAGSTVNLEAHHTLVLRKVPLAAPEQRSGRG